MKQVGKLSKTLYFSLQDQAIFQIWCQSSLDTDGTQLKTTLTNSEYWNKPHPSGCPPMYGYSRGPELYSDSIGISQFADSLLWLLQQCMSSRLTDSRLQNWEVGSTFRRASLSCRSLLHDRRSRSPGIGTQSISGSSVMIHGRHRVLSSTLNMCKPSKMESSAPVKLGSGPNWICRRGQVQITSDIWWPFDLPVNLRFWNFLTPKNPLRLLFGSDSRPEGYNWSTKQWLGKQT